MTDPTARPEPIPLPADPTGLRIDPGAVAGAVGGGLKDLFGKPLRGLLGLCVALAAALLAGAVWASLRFVVPLIPWEGWLGAGAEAAAAAGVVLAGIVLLPLVTMIAGGVLLDVAAERVERLRFPADPPGVGLPPHRAIVASARLTALALPLNILAVPLYFVPFLNIFVYWGLNGFLLGREYFLLAALRHRPWAAAQTVRKRNGLMVFLAGLAIAALMSVPVVNLCAPLFAIAVMVRLHKALRRT